MKKSIFSIVLLSALLIVLMGCGGQKPEDTVSKYLDASKILDAEMMATYIVPTNEEDITNTEELAVTSDDEYIKYFKEYVTNGAKKMTYSIKETEVSDNKAVITVDCKYVDGGPLLRATLGEAFTRILATAFSGIEQTEEETNQMFLDILKEKTQIIGETYKEATVKIDCVKQDEKWYIAEVNDDLEDVVTLGFASVARDLDDSFGGSSDSSNGSGLTIVEQAEKDDMTVFNKNIGDEITLATIIFKVNNVEEKSTLTAEYWEPTVAPEGTKFIVVNVDITNITNQEFTFDAEIPLIDSQGREYSSYDDTMMAIDDYIDYRALSPSIKESGYMVYQLPTDSTGYYLVIGKADTNELYKIIMN